VGANPAIEPNRQGQPQRSNEKAIDSGRARTVIIRYYGIYALLSDIDKGREPEGNSVVDEIIRRCHGIGFVELFESEEFNRDIVRYYHAPTAARFKSRTIYEEHLK